MVQELSKGVWVILERISVNDPTSTDWSPGRWRAVLASPGTPYYGPTVETPEEALSKFQEAFWEIWAASKENYTLQDMDDYPYGITEYAVRFISLPHLRSVK